MGRLIWIVAIVFYSLNTIAQTKISGYIIDANRKPIPSVSVILKDTSGNIVSYTYSNDQGQYKLNTSKKGKFVLAANAMQFEQKSIDITVEDIDISDIVFELNTKSNELREVIINFVRPITIDGDKVIFDAKSFAQGNEQVVEDLLKKIPGLNIAANGTIKVGNQEIEKVMIDGDDLFDRGYKILTKNMPVSPIDKIELLQRYSNNKHLKGIENSNKVALNLTLKEDAKRVWFGNIQAGFGLVSDNCYEVKGNLMNFGKKNKYYFLTNLNDIGFDAMGDIDNLVRPIRLGEPGYIGDNHSARTLLGLGGGSPNLKQKRVNFNNAEMLSQLQQLVSKTQKILWVEKPRLPDLEN